MKNKVIKLLGFLVGLLTLLVLAAPFSTLTVSASSTINVPGDYSTIQEAVAAANPGDNIEVTGTYNELVYIGTNGITLRGEGAILDGTGLSFHGLMTIWTFVHGVTIEGFEIRNLSYGDHGGNGIWLRQNSYGNTIRDNVIHDVNGAGVLLGANSSGNLVTGNYVYNAENGIGVNTSYDNEIVSNKTEATNHGIFLSGGSSGNIICGNEDINCLSDGIQIWDSVENKISDNQIQGSIGNGIILLNAEGNKIDGNMISNSGACGIGVNRSTGNDIKGNVITGSTDHAILLNVDSNNNKVEKNTISDNGKAGIQVLDANINQIMNNEIANCLDGIRVLGSANNNKVAGNIVEGSTRYGILAADITENNIFKKNEVAGSLSSDLFQAGSADNIWKNNEYDTSNL